MTSIIRAQKLNLDQGQLPFPSKSFERGNNLSIRQLMLKFEDT